MTAGDPAPPPAAGLIFRSDAGPEQLVCQLSAAGRLKELCFDGFPASAGTIGVWLRVPATAAVDATVLAYVPPGASGSPDLRVINPQNLEVHVGANSGGPTGVLIADDVWRQLTVTCQRVDPSTWILTIYLDSLPLWQSRAQRSPQTFTSGGDLYLGWDGSSGGDLAGLASELQVWATPLDERAVGTGLLRRAVDGTQDLALHWPLDAAPPGNPNAVIVASQLRFRTGAATVSWAQITGATGYEIEAGSTDGRWNNASSVGQVTSYVLPGSPLNATLGARYRGVLSTGPTPWSPVTQITAFELVQTEVTLDWDAGTAVLLAAWPDVPRRDSYTLELFQAGTDQPQVTTGYAQLSYALTSKLDDPSGWLLDVRAFAAGSLGPAEPSLPMTAPSLTSVLYDSVAQVLSVNWTAVAGAQYCRLRVTAASGTQQPYAVMLDGTATSATVTNAQFPLQQDITYTVALRALGNGTLTSWASATVGAHTVPAPVLAWAQAPAPDLLDATWNAVAAGATYNLALYRGTEVNPVVTRDGMSTTSFALAACLDDNSVYAVRVAAIDQNVLGPANVPGTPGTLSPAWHYLAATQTLDATWAAGEPSAYLRVYIAGQTAPAQAALGDGSHATFPAPDTTYPEGTAVTLNCRGLVPGALGLIETAALTVHLLAAPAPALQYQELPAAAAGTGGTACLTASWAAISPPLAVAYQVQITTDGQAGPIQDATGQQFDVTSQLDAPGTIGIAVRGTADGSIGPWSAAVPPAAPAWRSATYDVAAGAVTAGWTAPAGLDASYAELVSSAAPVRQWLSGTAVSAVLAVPAGQAGQPVTLRLRSVAGAAMSAFATQSMTLLQVPGPVLNPLTDTVSPNSVSASWSFDMPAGTTGLGYVAELSSGGTVLATSTITDPATKSTTFSESADVHFVVSQLYSVRVRAQVRPLAGQQILGAWSGTASINFGADVNLTLSTMTPNSNAAGDLTVSWAMAHPVTDATFDLQILDGSTVYYSRTGLTGTLVELKQSDTHVVVGKTYTVQMRAVYGPNSGQWKQGTVQAGNTPPPPPSPSRNDPISIRTGALTQSGVDLLVPAVVPLAFTVTYRSNSPLPTDPTPLPSTPLGARWNHVYNTRIAKAADGKTVALIGGDLTIVIYTVPPSITGNYPQQGIPNGSTLFVGADLACTLTRADGSMAGFDPSGAMQWMADPAGNRTQLAYSGGRLSRVTDAGSGRWLNIGYDGNGRISSVTASTGVSIGYGYDAAGNLTSSTDPLGGTRGFSYDASSRLTGVTDQMQRPALRNVYDSQGRISLQQDARALAENQGYGTGFAYSSGGGIDAVVVTNRDGEVTTYGFDSTAGILLSETVGLAPGTVWRVTFTRDANGNAVTRSVFEGPPGSAGPGLTWTYTYDGIGNVTSVTDPLGGTARTSYDIAYHPVSRTDRLGNTTTLTWAGNLLTRVTDPVGGTTTRSYAPGLIRGLLQRETDPYGATAEYTYDQAGQLTRVVDATGAITVPTWSALGWPAGFALQTAAGGAVFTQESDTDAMGRPLTQRERYTGQPATSPFTTTSQYAPTGTLSSVTDPLNGVLTLGYDPDLNLTQITFPAAAPPGDRTVYGYDRENRLTSIDYGAGVIEGFTSDPLGRPTSYTDPNQQVWRVSYTMSGQDLVQTATLPVNNPATSEPLTQAMACDPLGRVVSITDTAGGVTTISYAAVPIPGTATFGLQVTTTLPQVGQDTITRSQTFDSIGRLVASVNENGKVTSCAYALASTVPSPPPGAVVAVTMTRPTGLTELYLLDGAGRLLQTRRGTGAAQRLASRTYDPLGRVIAASQQGGILEASATCGYAWDNGAIVATVTADGGAAAGPVLRYDALGRLMAVSDRAGQSVSYSYTPAGLLASCTDAAGQQVGYTHDAAARLTQLTLPGSQGTITHVLDGSGNRTQTLLSGAVAITRTFDALDRLTSRTAAGATVGCSYDTLGGLATLSYPAQPGQNPPQVSYQRDPIGRLASVTDWANRVTSYSYLPTGALSSQQSPNNLRTDYAYDDDDRLTSLATSSSGLVIAEATYGYDAFDAPVTLSELLPAPARPAAGTQTLSYTGDRLTAFNGVALSYDADGNLLNGPTLAGPLGYDVFGELVTAGQATIARDPDGVLTSITSGGQSTTFVHDAGGYASPLREQADLLRALGTRSWQPLPAGGTAITPVLSRAGMAGGGAGPDDPAVLGAAAAAPDGSGGSGAAGTGAQVTGAPAGLAGAAITGTGFTGTSLAGPWTTGGTGAGAGGTVAASTAASSGQPDPFAATCPAWSGPLAALDRRLSQTTGNQTTRYIYGAGLIGAERPDGSFASYVFDGQGSTLALALPDGTLASRQTYDLFGTILGGDTDPQPFGFAGRLGVAAEIGWLALMRTRAYSPYLMRFTSQDYLLGTVTDAQSLNRYSYLRGAPLLRVDPLGEDGFPLWGKIVLGVGLGVVGTVAVVGGLYAFGVIGGGAGATGAGGTALGSYTAMTEVGEVVGSTRTYAPGLRNRFWWRRQPQVQSIEMSELKKDV